MSAGAPRRLDKRAHEIAELVTVIIPSSDQLSERIQKHCEYLAREIARRVHEDNQTYATPTQCCERHAKAVLLDWFLGDFIPGG